MCAEYVANAPTYDSALEFVQSGVQSADVTALKMWLRRYINDKELAFCLADSTTDSTNCKKVTIKTGSVGRPKKQVQGIKVDRHLHGVIVTKDKSTDINTVKSDLTEYCNKRRKKRPNLKQQKTAVVSGMYIAKYIDRQSDHTYIGGDFDFDYFTDDRYFTPYEND
jgi:hypothetical protein